MHGLGLADEEVVLSRKAAYKGKYPERMRRVRALVEIDGGEREMEFLTNNMDWSPRSIADIYRSRWNIEVFFKQIKQTLKLADFLGHSANAVRWQVWSALLCYLLLRFQAFLSGWGSSFTRLFTLIRSALWQKFDLLSLKKLWDSRRELSSYGDSRNRLLPGIQALVYGTALLSLNYYPREKIEILKVIFLDFKSDPLHCLLSSTLFASVGRRWVPIVIPFRGSSLERPPNPERELRGLVR
jgi:hypothetical protein